MNREIKFRAWSEKFIDKPMEYFELGEFFFDKNGISIPFEETEVMQYTGLKDKNGKEIYEGDILSYKSAHPKHDGKVFNNVVEFAIGQSLCGWRMRNKSCIVKATPYKFVISEIIGNIYENPELLETKKAQLSEPKVEK